MNTCRPPNHGGNRILTLLRASKIGLKYTKISPLDAFAILYKHSAEKYLTRFSTSVKQPRSGSTNFSIYGAIPTPRAIAVPASPINPPFRTWRGLEVLLNISTSWSTIWLIRLLSPCRLHSLVSLRAGSYQGEQLSPNGVSEDGSTSQDQGLRPSASRTSCPPAVSRLCSLHSGYCLNRGRRSETRCSPMTNWNLSCRGQIRVS